MELNGLKVLVAGGAGFIGSYIVDSLLDVGAEVTVFDEFLYGDKNLQHVKKNIQIIKGDITDCNQVNQASEGKDVLIHVAFPAALCDLSLSNQFIETGTIGTFNLLRAAKENDSVFIYGSSISVYGKQIYQPVDEQHPLNPIITYGATKLVGEVYCRSFQHEFGLKTVILRYSDVYGPRSKRIGAPTAFLLKALNDEPIQIHGDGLQMRDYTYVTDIADATVLAINDCVYGETFNIASGRAYSIVELARIVKKITNSDSRIVFVSNDEIKSNKYIANDTRKYSISIEKAKKLLKFIPNVMINDGIEITKQWISENPSILSINRG